MLGSGVVASIRRCRPLLGTYVEMSARGAPEILESALQQAFAAMERVQQLMSVQTTESELSRVNREASRHPVTLHPWTWRVLQAGQRLAEESGGAFDFTAAPSDRQQFPGNWRDLELRTGRQVRFGRPLQLDLGGIAKGFAVDRAIEALRRAGAISGLVNAGGDSRLFGPEGQTFHLRHPGSARVGPVSLSVRQAALATSAPTFSRRKVRGRWISDLVDPRRGRAFTSPVSITVVAPTCLWADALTKAVWVLGEQAAPLLARHQARAWIWSPNDA